MVLSRGQESRENTLSLNVGCGATNKYPFQDFNCYINCDFSIPEMKIKNYIQCDAMNLPFRPVFNYLIASQIVEHLPTPDRAIKEFKKMSRYIVIVVPHPFSPTAYIDPSHRVVRFNEKWLKIPIILKILVQPIILRYVLSFVSLLLGLPNDKIIEIRGNVI